jgi:hypothetical protein
MVESTIGGMVIYFIRRALGLRNPLLLAGEVAETLRLLRAVLDQIASGAPGPQKPG